MVGTSVERNGQPMTRDIAERFWEKVDKSGECWLWLASRDPSGYGHFGMGSRTDGTRVIARAHRVAYWLTHGEMPDSERLLHHTCENPSCVRPDHLELVTVAEHVVWKHRNGPPGENAHRTHCRRGHPLSGDNLATERGGGRRCLACKKLCRERNRHERNARRRRQYAEAKIVPWASMDNL